MKKQLIKTILILGIIITINILLTTVSEAALSISTSKNSVSPGESFNVTVSVSSNEAGAINLSIENGTLSQTYIDLMSQSSVTLSCTAGSAGTVIIRGSGLVANYITLIEESQSAQKTVSIVQPVVEPEPPVTPTLSSNANLSNLGINPYDFKGFKAAKTSYSVSVPNDVSSINIYAYAQDSKAKVSGTGSKNLSVGQNTFKVVCTAENGTQKTYTLYITRKAKETEEVLKSSDATLSNLVVAEGILNPLFDPSIKEYTLNITEEIAAVNITATPNNDKAIVSIEGGVELQLGENIATITITAEDGTANVYTIKIIKQKELIVLQTLVIGYIDENGKLKEMQLSPAFNSEIYEYKLEDIEYNIDNLKIDALVTNENLIIEIKGNEKLKEGENIITIIVRKEPTTELEEAKEIEYKVIVNKKAAPVPAKTGIIGQIKNFFTALPGTIKNFAEENQRIILISSLVFCIVAMIGLSIYIVFDYKRYKMILNKISILVKANSEEKSLETIEESNKNINEEEIKEKQV